MEFVAEEHLGRHVLLILIVENCLMEKSREK
jgi:hypothetical protein